MGEEKEVKKERHMDFGGTPGAVATMIGLPITVILLHVCARYSGWGLLQTFQYDFLNNFVKDFSPNWYSVNFVFWWMLVNIVLYLYFPGRDVDGLPDPDNNGVVLSYRINGIASYSIQAFFIFFGYTRGWYDVVKLVDNYSRIMIVTGIFASLGSLFLYIKASHLAEDYIYDYFKGVEKNPRIGRFDFKFFFEGRPGLTAWSLMGWVFAFYQREKVGFISTPMLLCNFFHTLYVVDYYVFEEFILSTFDIVYDPFGWMLFWGDIGLVPFAYVMQEWYLIGNNLHISTLSAVAIFVAGIAGYVSFRLSNKERNDLKMGLLKDPTVMKMKNKDGSEREYLISGFSSLCRRPNYWPDLLNALTYALTCGFGAALPWFHFIFFLGLLVHRDNRIEDSGIGKYENWQEYKDAVPYRMIPYIY